MRTLRVPVRGIFSLSWTLLLGCQEASPRGTSSTSSSDSAFALVQARGQAAMGVDQYTSTHRFESLPQGGRITLMRDPDDSAGVAQIRAHMNQILAAFRQGDFAVPGFVHDRPVPGSSTMAAHRSRIRYSTHNVPGGGSLVIETSDTAALRGVHEFLAFQRHDHRSEHAGTSH
jgi:hypothetical protein